jgi:ribosomal protein L31E
MSYAHNLCRIKFVDWRKNNNKGETCGVHTRGKRGTMSNRMLRAIDRKIGFAHYRAHVQNIEVSKHLNIQVWSRSLCAVASCYFVTPGWNPPKVIRHIHVDR